MSTVWLRAGRIAVVMSMAAVTLLAGPAPAQAVAPPAVSHLAATRYDHSLTLSWYNPAAAYQPGASVVVRFAVGRTAPATPGSAYAATVSGGRFATIRSLRADSSYTFAVWVRNGSGQYSPRRVLTTTTRPDVTAPGSVLDTGAHGRRLGGRASVALTWTRPEVPDLAGVRVVRSASPTPTGGTVLATAAGGTSFTDSTLVPGISDLGVEYWYYLAARDTSGHFSPYVLVPVRTPTSDTTSAMAGVVTSSAGRGLSDVVVRPGSAPAPDPGIFGPVTDSRGAWGSRAVAGVAEHWTYLVGYGEHDPTPGRLPLSHQPYGYLSQAGAYPALAPGEFRSVRAVLSPAGAVTGVVRTSEGTLLAGIPVTAYGSDVTATTDAGGRYLVFGVLPGDSEVFADGTRLVTSQAPYGFTGLWSGDTTDSSEASPIPVVGGRASVLDFVLPARGRVTGTVDDANALIDVRDSAGRMDSLSRDGLSWTADRRPGSYTVCATVNRPLQGGAPHWVGGCWDGTTMVPWDRDDPPPPSTVGKVQVVPGQLTHGIDLTTQD